MLSFWTDFADIKDDGHTWVTLRFARYAPGEEPRVGGLAEVWDYEGNRCRCVVTRLDGPIVHVKLDWSTWVPA